MRYSWMIFRNDKKQMVAKYGILCYSIMLILVILYFDDATRFYGMAFVIVNCTIGLVFVANNHYGRDKIMFYVIYYAYTIVYIFKAIVLRIMGLNTEYIYSTIGTVIQDADYIFSLGYVTIGNLVITGVFYVFSGFCAKPKVSLPSKRYMSDKVIKGFLVIIFVFIIVSSIVMLKYGVAVMGGKGVSLPYKMSGLFFYSRLLVLPVLFLCFLEKAIVRQNRKLFVAVIMMFLLLAFSEMGVRASKAVVFYLVTYVGCLFFILYTQNVNIAMWKIKKKILLLLGCAFLLFPAVDIYRSIVVSGVERRSFFSVFEMFVQSLRYQKVNYFLFTFERFFHRLGGFTQTAGLVSDRGFQHDLSTVLSYGSVSQYYTRHYLGFTMENHASSPSLIGASIILGGEQFWYIVFIAYIVIMIALWRCTAWFKIFGNPLKCLLCVQVFKGIMEGAIKASLYQMGIIFTIATIMEIMLELTSRTVKTSL